MLPFLKAIPHLPKIVSPKKHCCILFNFDELVRSTEDNFRELLDRFSRIAPMPKLYVGIVSRQSLAQLYKISPHSSLILAGSGGCEIDSPYFSWAHPQTSTAQQQLENISRLLKMDIGPAWTVQNVIVYGITLTIILNPEELRISRQIKQLLQRILPETILSTSWQKNTLTIRPQFQFDKQQALRKIIELLPGDIGLPPVVFYFGADISDEPAFREANLNGYSILLRENIGRQTAAQYYLRNRNELNKVLIWLNSQ